MRQPHRRLRHGLRVWACHALGRQRCNQEDHETAIDDARAAAADVMTSHALAQGAESDRAMQNSFITLGE